MDEERRKEFDDGIAALDRTITPKPRSKVPSWWPGEDAASRDNLEAARQMGYAVGVAG